MLKFLRNALIGALALLAGGVGATSLSLLSGPHPAADMVLTFNTLITNINAMLAPLGVGQINTAQTTFKPMGTIYSTNGATVGIGALTTEQVLATATLATGSLDQAGRRVHVRAVFSTALGSNTAKTAKCNWNAGSDGTHGTTFSTGPLGNNNASGDFTGGTNGATIICDMVITQTATTGQQVASGYLMVQGATEYTSASSALFYAAYATAVNTGPVKITATAVNGTAVANAIVLDELTVEYMN